MKKLFRKRCLTSLSRTLVLLLATHLISLGNTQSSTVNNLNITGSELMSITVQEGDSLAMLATTYGITVRNFMELNMLDSTFIQTGLTLFVPVVNPKVNPIRLATSIDSVTTPETTVLETITSQTNALTDGTTDDRRLKTIAVPQGATLSELAIAYGSSIEAIQSHNQLSDYTIYAGQKLQIPVGQTVQTTNRQPDSAGYITVLPNDTISALATTFCSSPELLLGQNSLTSPDIYIGQRLFVGQTNTITAMLVADSTNTVASFSENPTSNDITRVASLFQQTVP